MRVPGNIADGTNADIACNSYYKYVEDVQLLKDMGVSALTFLILNVLFYSLASTFYK